MIGRGDILIIGGGVSGMLTALELRLAGRDVIIIDKNRSGRESSWAGGGILLPIYPWRQPQAISELVVHSVKEYPRLSQELLRATGIDPEWRDCGILICKNPDLQAADDWLRHYRIPAAAPPDELLDSLRTVFQQPLWLPKIAQIRNPRLLQSLTAYLLQLGVKIIENAEIGNAIIKQGRISRIDVAGQSISLNELVICAGAWTPSVLQSLLPAETGFRTPAIEPVKGQMLVFDAQPETLRTMVLDGDRYLIPRRDGKILAGSTVETAGFDKTATQEARDSLYDFAIGLLPALKQFQPSHHWAGLRPGSPQGIPYISRLPDLANLGVNAGHFRNGLVMGPASARLLADLILDRQPVVDPRPYALT